MLKCWEENPSDRPTFAKLKNTMKEMERSHRVMHLEIQAFKLLFSFILFFVNVVVVVVVVVVIYVCLFNFFSFFSWYCVGNS